MAEEGNKLARKALRTSYISTIISISLVLFLIGTLGILVLNAQRISEYVKENVVMTVMLKPDSKEEDVTRLINMLNGSTYVKATKYINSETAAQELSKDLGEDFVKSLGYNPLSGSIDIFLKAEYADNTSINGIRTSLSNTSIVKEIYYQPSLIEVINKNIRTISLIILGFSALLFLIAGALINNTIRLSLYAKRLLIKSMKLVGATRSFIRKPFLVKGMMHGFYGGIIADILLFGLLYVTRKQVPEFFGLQDTQLLLIIMGGVIVIGVFVSLVSTYFAVNKYLRLNTEDLY